MLIGVEKRFLFVANTKTASTSIEQALLPFSDIRHGGNPRRKHIALSDGLEAYGHLLGGGADVFKFGVIRDPIDWILSWFRYRRGNDVESPLPHDMDFETFWRRGDWNIWRKEGEKFLQRRMFCDAQDRVLADAVIPYDRLGAVFGEIADCLGVPSSLPRANVSRTRETGEIPHALLDEMRAFYEDDYALLGRVDEINARGLAELRESRRAVPS